MEAGAVAMLAAAAMVEVVMALVSKVAETGPGLDAMAGN